MKSYWNYRDSLDLEFFIQRDAESSDAALHDRDRTLFLEKIKPSLPENRKMPTSSLLQGWLEARRGDMPPESRLPGSMAGEIYTLLKFALTFCGLVTGWAAGFLYLNYSGETPVNVLPFLALFVLSQLGLALIVLFRQGIYRLVSRRYRPRSLALLLLSSLTVKGYRLLLNKLRESTSTDHFNSLQAAIGRGRGVRTVHGEIFYWPLFLLLQLSGISFNIGLIASILLKVSVSDIAFGWQSTLQISAQSLHSLTGWMSLPWSWFMKEGIGYPTPADVEGSRIILKEGISHLMTENLISWWPFLLMSVFTYGLLVRLLFFFYGKYQERRFGTHFEITTPAVNQIIRRMQTPLVTTRAQPEPSPSEPDRPGSQPPTAPTETTTPLLPVAVLLPDECFDSCSTDELSLLLAREGFTFGPLHRFQADYESDQQILRKLAAESDESLTGIIIIIEAWMPPLMEFLSFVQNMRKSTGDRLPIAIRLIGKPTKQTVLTPATETAHLRVWKKKIESLGDPYLTLSPLVSQDNT